MQRPMQYATPILGADTFCKSTNIVSTGELFDQECHGLDSLSSRRTVASLHPCGTEARSHGEHWWTLKGVLHVQKKESQVRYVIHRDLL